MDLWENSEKELAKQRLMDNEDLTNLYQRRISEAQAEQAYYQSKIDDASHSTNHHQLDTWRDRVRHWQRQERMYRTWLEKLLEDDR